MPTSIRIGMGVDGDISDSSRLSRRSLAPGLIVEEGLELSIVKDDDAEEMFLKIEENRAYLREWLPWLDDTKTLQDEISFIAICLDDFEKRKGAFYAIRFHGEIIGTISINWIDWANKGCGVGYWLSESHMGRGYVTKACNSLMEHCFEGLGLHRFVLESAVENHASRAVAERLGLRMEGISKDREWLYDHFTDSVMYAITYPEWKSSTQR